MPGLAPGKGWRAWCGSQSAGRLGAGAAVRARVDHRGGAAACSAFLVGVGRVVLEFVVEADVVHVLEDVELVTGDLHRAVAPVAQQGLGLRWHGLIMPAGPDRTRALFLPRHAVTAAALPGVRFGWNDACVMGHLMLTPEQTMARPRCR